MLLYYNLLFIERILERHPELYLCFIVAIILFGYALIFNLTREKLENEDKKEEYLKRKFHNETLSLKEDEFSAEIIVHKPYSKKKPWVVKKSADRGFQGSGSFKSQHKDYLLYEILDDDLDKLIT